MRRDRLLAVALLLCLLAVVGRAAAQSPDQLETALALDQAATLAESGDLEGCRAVLDRLEQQGQIRAESWTALLETEPDRVAEQLRQSATLLRTPPHELPPNAEQRLEVILTELSSMTLWERFLFWLSQIVGRLAGPWIYWLRAVAGLVGVLIAILLLWLFVRGLRRLKPRRAAPFALEGEIPAHAEGAQSQAVTAARAGDYREAMRLLYLAALLHLDEVGRLRFDRALTNQEVLSSVRDDRSLRVLLSPVVSQFDRVWYGHAPFGADDFAVMERQLTALRQMGVVR